MDTLNVSETEDTKASSGGIPELNEMDLTNVDTSFPVLKPGPYAVKLVGFEIKKGKSKAGEPTFNNLQVTLSLVNEEQDKDGKPIKAGFKFIETVTLKQSPDFDPRKRLAQMQECFLGTKGKWDAEALKGQEGVVRLSLKSDDEFGERNRVAAWVVKKASAPVSIG